MSFETIMIPGMISILGDYLPVRDVIKIIKLYPDVKKHFGKKELFTDDIKFCVDHLPVLKDSKIVLGLNLRADSPNCDELKNLFNLTVTNESLMDLTNLSALCLNPGTKITDHGIKNLTKLTSLDLFDSRDISGEGLENLTYLRFLSLCYNGCVSNVDIFGSSRQ